jgi:stearoyl-CoA desaturase (delta-9 desaturase)
MSNIVDLASRPPRGATIRGSGGRLAHKLHALLIVVLPTAAVFYAGWAIICSRVESWQIYLLLICYFLTTLAIRVGFHRLLTHRAFQTVAPVKAALAILASMAGQGTPIYWVSNHRRHHHYADRDGDPHSPVISNGHQLGAWSGFWHAHVGWTFDHDLSNSLEYAPDLLKDPTVRWVGRHYFSWLLLGVLLPALAGAAINHSWNGFAQGILWGGLVRMFVTNQFTNGINSAAHMWGYQRYETDDGSRNNWLLGIFTLGEGWHNNHHANWRSAIFSRAWYEIDVGGMFVLLLERLGLAHNVRRAGRGGFRRGAESEDLRSSLSEERHDEP